jgi:hypothetical protein
VRTIAAKGTHSVPYILDEKIPRENRKLASRIVFEQAILQWLIPISGYKVMSITAPKG